MIKGIFLILLYLFLGETCSYFIGGMVPGSVLGMLLLFASLTLGIVKAEDVRGVANFLTRNMALFFVPASIGVMTSWNMISANLLPLVVISVSTTMLVIAVVAIIQEKSEKRKIKKECHERNAI